VPVVYTPHCYATERLDVGFLPRLAFRRAERLLTRRTASVAAVSPREAELAREFNTGQHVVYVPNIASPSGFRYPGRRPGALQVMAIGRLCPQKGPEFFAAAAAASHDPEIEWTWVGDGDASYRTQLEAAGVSVTGWQPRDIALKYLQSADVYVHTAAWEGAPMTVLEAAAFGIPIVGRHVPALERLGIDLLFKTPEDLSDALSNLAMAPSLSDLMRASEELASRHTPAAQRQALLAAYSAALNSDLGEQFSRFSESQALAA
jgi:glycosyltransferase involved in cell wall biosynthesis